MLVNLGTPDLPTTEAIKAYLAEFLSDPRVVDLPRWLWLPILKGIILRTRPPRLVEKYELVWGKEDGPIRNITHALAGRVQTVLPDLEVESAMTYGNPSIKSVLDKLSDAEEITVLPLFPQYAGATTGAVEDALNKALNDLNLNLKTTIIHDYHAHAGYIEALADCISCNYQFRVNRPHLVFSFHGIPQSQSDKGDPYAQQCETTAALVAARLGLDNDTWTLSYQSRFGPAPWLQPYTDATMASLPRKGIRDVAVICPGFSVDCLETIEEIRELNREIFLDAGGQSFTYIKALNATARHATVIAELILNSAGN